MFADTLVTIKPFLLIQHYQQHRILAVLVACIPIYINSSEQKTLVDGRRCGDTDKTIKTNLQEGLKNIERLMMARAFAIKTQSNDD